MVMPNEAIKEFSDLCEKEFGIKLSPREAKIRAERLLKIFNRAIFLENQKENENGI